MIATRITRFVPLARLSEKDELRRAEGTTIRELGLAKSLPSEKIRRRQGETRFTISAGPTHASVRKEGAG